MAETLEKVDATSFKRIRTVEEVVNIKELRQERANLILQLEEMAVAKENLLAAIVARRARLDEVKEQIKAVVALGIEDKEND